MAKKSYTRVVLAGLTLGLVACEQSITGVADPADDFEAMTSVPLSHGICLAPGDDLISWWPGDSDFKDIAEPLAGANDITVISDDGAEPDPIITVMFEKGMVDEAFRFTTSENQGLVQFLEVANADELQPTNFTIDLWAKRLGPGQNSNQGVGSMLIQKAVVDGANEGLSYFIAWNGAGKITAKVNFGGGEARLESGSDFVEDEWVHIALTVDGSTARLYLNGNEVQAISDVDGTTVYGGGSVVIGSNWEYARRPTSGGFQRGFNGLIDEVDLYGRALSAGDIAAIYAAGDDGKCKGSEPPGPQGITIDIKPGSDSNSINTKSRGVIPVAILGSADFDVNDVDVTTLTFGPGGATPAHEAGGHLEDVNDDGYDDLVSHYRTQESDLSSDDTDTEACVNGSLLDDTEIHGCDAVSVKD